MGDVFAVGACDACGDRILVRRDRPPGAVTACSARCTATLRSRLESARDAELTAIRAEVERLRAALLSAVARGT